MNGLFHRINFFKGLFMKESDWQKEQQYHIEKQRFHNKYLHTPGVVFDCLERLKVSVSKSGTSFIVAPGYAIDGEGRDIYLPEPREIPIPDLQSFNPPANIYIIIRYNESFADRREDAANPMYTGFAYISEEAIIEITLAEPDNHHSIELGRIRLSENPGTITNPDSSPGSATLVAPDNNRRKKRTGAGKAIVPTSMETHHGRKRNPLPEEPIDPYRNLSPLDQLDLSHVPEAGSKSKTRSSALSLSDLGEKLVDTPLVVAAGNRKQEDTNILIEQYPKNAVQPMYMACVQSMDGVRTRWSIVCHENDEGSLDYNLHIRNEASHTTTVMCRVYRVRL